MLVDEHVRINPDLNEGTTESRSAVIATAVSAFADEVIEAVDEHGQRDVYMYRVAGLMLGGVLVAQGSPAPARSVAYGAYERITEALYAGDGARKLDAVVELVRHVAGFLDGLDDGCLLEWLADNDLAGHLEVEGNRLRQSAARLAVLRERAAVDLASQDIPPADDETDHADRPGGDAAFGAERG